MPNGWGEFLSPSKMVTMLRGVHFPCSRQELIQHVEDHSVPKVVMDILCRLPEREYRSPADVVDSAMKSAH